MKLEKAERLYWALEPLEQKWEMLVAVVKSMRFKLANILNWDVPEEELDEVGKMKGRIFMYGTQAKKEVDYIIQHY